MPWIIGGVSALSWSAARDKVRGDLWRKGTTAIPDDVVDRALHASILDIESRRKWQFLESVTSSITLSADANSLSLPAGCGAVQSLAVFVGSNPWANPLELVPLPIIRDMLGSTHGYPSYCAVSNGSAFFDCIVPGGTRFELIFQSVCPDLLDDAVETPPVTLGLHQQAVLAGAKALVALEYLHDDEKAARNSAAFEKHVNRMEDHDDQLRGGERGGTIQPNISLYDAAYGPGGPH
jgi:hypothetical protein